MNDLNFYMVFLEGERNPAYKHPDEATATKEAKRLARLHDKKAFVLKPVKAVEVTYKETRNFDTSIKIDVDTSKIFGELDAFMAITSLMPGLQSPKSARGFLRPSF